MDKDLLFSDERFKGVNEDFNLHKENSISINKLKECLLNHILKKDGKENEHAFYDLYQHRIKEFVKIIGLKNSVRIQNELIEYFINYVEPIIINDEFYDLLLKFKDDSKKIPIISDKEYLIIEDHFFKHIAKLSGNDNKYFFIGLIEKILYSMNDARTQFIINKAFEYYKKNSLLDIGSQLSRENDTAFLPIEIVNFDGVLEQRNGIIGATNLVLRAFRWQYS